MILIKGYSFTVSQLIGSPLPLPPSLNLRSLLSSSYASEPVLSISPLVLVPALSLGPQGPSFSPVQAARFILRKCKPISSLPTAYTSQPALLGPSQPVHFFDFLPYKSCPSLHIPPSTSQINHGHID